MSIVKDLSMLEVGCFPDGSIGVDVISHQDEDRSVTVLCEALGSAACVVRKNKPYGRMWTPDGASDQKLRMFFAAALADLD